MVEGNSFRELCGATGPFSVDLGSRDGLSPRGRGNPLLVADEPGAWRSIPAWAGQPHYLGGCPAVLKVYPRVGGATRSTSSVSIHSRGLSPRGRGNQVHFLGLDPLPGSIPAWAGQPQLRVDVRGADEVYPRVGGATVAISCAIVSLAGLSPRGRGNLTVASRSG